jgi:hypothetical protein
VAKPETTSNGVYFHRTKLEELARLLGYEPPARVHVSIRAPTAVWKQVDALANDSRDRSRVAQALMFRGASNVPRHEHSTLTRGMALALEAGVRIPAPLDGPEPDSFAGIPDPPTAPPPADIESPFFEFEIIDRLLAIRAAEAEIEAEAARLGAALDQLAALPPHDPLRRHYAPTAHRALDKLYELDLRAAAVTTCDNVVTDGGGR